jgi:uncharacterized protein (TIGR02145 family)
MIIMHFILTKLAHNFMLELVSKSLRWFLTLLAIVVFTTCIKDPQLPEMEYPVLLAREVTDINVDGATLYADVINGADKIIEFGFVWGLNKSPSLKDQIIILNGKVANFTFRITTGMRENETYYVRAFSKTSKFTVFSNEISFKSQGSEGEIEITTLPISYITAYSAISGGKILLDGSSDIISRGLVWGIVNNPTISDHQGITKDGEGMGEFISIATDLIPKTKYFIRPYAINRKDTAYGETISFTTLKNYIVPGDGVTDIEGNHYPSVIIGNQEWMAKNLKSTKYRNGAPISTELSEYNEGFTIYSHSWIDNLNTSLAVVNAYGALYNFYAVTDHRGLCPVGWKVPDENDFETLKNYVIETMDSSNDPWHPDAVGSHLRSARQVNSPLGSPFTTSVHPRWGSSKSYGRDTFGFSGLPGGQASGGNSFYGIGHEGSWWTSTRRMGIYGLALRLNFFYNDLNPGNGGNWVARSVRCIKE